MEFRILGPLEVCADGCAVAVAGSRPRAVLAALVLNRDRAVSAERLAIALWGEDAPTGAGKRIQVHVSRLRKALGESDVIITTPAGYRLRVEAEQVDCERFARDVAAARRSLRAGDVEQAAVALRNALELWRGTPLSEFTWAPFASAETSRLEEMRVSALELRIEADLAVGRHAELVSELWNLRAEHPWRERLHGQLMLALYRSGRQADALEAYRHSRAVLVEQLGVEPGPELRDLHHAMLVHDAALELPWATVRTASGARTVLPAVPNRTIGRVAELAAIANRLRANSTRLLTLTGPGGVGKTRLALEAAHLVEADFADGAQLVSFSDIRRPNDVAATVVKTLGISASPGESAERAVERFLAGRHTLLVMDNCEHVLSAAPFIAALLDGAPALTVLATSREPLALHAEQRFLVPPLALPEPTTSGEPRTLAVADAVALFCERAASHDPGFDLEHGNAAIVTEICRRLDGLPLAIELAAARCELLSPAEIARRLHEPHGTGPRDSPARQRTLRATIDWSHRLLNDREKRCFAAFAAFAGGATVHAAEAVTGCDLDTLEALVAKSLFFRRARIPTRLGMLETIREYAAEQLAAAGAGPVRQRHYEYFLAIAHEHGTARALMSAERDEHLPRLDAEIDNLHSALDWAITEGDADRALALATALGDYWRARSRLTDAADRIEQTLGLPGADARTARRAGALIVHAWCRWALGDPAGRHAALIEAEAIARELGDPILLSHALQTRADDESSRDRIDIADTLADQALELAAAAGDQWELARASRAKARAARTPAERRERVDAAATRLVEVGNIFDLAYLLTSAAYTALGDGCVHDARAYTERAIPITRTLDNPFMWMNLQGNLALAALLTGDTDAATHAYREELALSRHLAVPAITSESLLGLAAIEAIRGDPARAARLAGGATAPDTGPPPDPVATDPLQHAFLSPARTLHGASAWDAALREGRAMSREDTIAYALQEPHAPPPHDASNRAPSAAHPLDQAARHPASNDRTRG